MIKAIIFDIGGVLIDVDIEYDKKMYHELLGFSGIDDLLDPCHQRGIYSDLEEGKIGADEFRRYILSHSRLGSTPDDVDRCVAALLKEMPPYKAELLTELSRHYEVCILSNNNEISIKYCHDIFTRAGLDWQKVISREYLSFKMKLLKPDPRIYTAVLRDIGLPPEEILFIDDAADNVQVASEMGIRAVLFGSGQDLRDVVRKALEEMD